MQLSKREMRQIKNMSSVCRFDMDKQVAVMRLRYDTPDELLDTHLSCPGKPVISNEAVDYLCDLMSEIPKDFTVEFELAIDDYGEYDHESLMNALRATIENTFYYHDESRKKDNVLAVIFLITGILLLALETVGGMAGWYGGKGSISTSIVETVLDVMVWVFIWEGAYILFLTYENDSTVFYQNMRRFHGLRFLNENGNALCSLDEEQLYQGWIYLSLKEVLARSYILFSNAALLGILSILTVERFAGIEKISTVSFAGFAISWVLTVALVLSNISFYRESGKLRHWALWLSVICLIFTVGSLIYSVMPGSVFAAYPVWDTVLSVVLLLNVVCLVYMRRQNVNIER